jgi:hypothetical protein
MFILWMSPLARIDMRQVITVLLAFLLLLSSP